MNVKKAVFNWSGGKDSALCLYHALKDESIDIRYLVTTMNEANSRISMHGVRDYLLSKQAENIGINIKQIMLPEKAPIDVYDKIMYESMQSVTAEGIEYSIFGDIFLEDLRTYREEKLKEAGMKALFPLWKRRTNELINEFIELGFKAVIVCVNAKYLDKTFLGRVIDKEFIASLPANVDPCGENGEYHSFVFDGPIFNKPVEYKCGEIVEREYKPNSGSDQESKDKKIQCHDTRFYYMDIL